jgi:hypothetical protein
MNMLYYFNRSIAHPLHSPCCYAIMTLCANTARAQGALTKWSRARRRDLGRRGNGHVDVAANTRAIASSCRVPSLPAGGFTPTIEGVRAGRDAPGN